MVILARKVQVDKAGNETEVPMNDLIEIGVFKKGKEKMQKSLYLKKTKNSLRH